MQKIYFIDESLDKMGGVERVINTLVNNLNDEYNIELISELKSMNNTYFTYPKDVKINYIYDKSNLFSKKFKFFRPLYLFIRLFEKAEENLKTYILAKNFSKKITKDDIVVFGRVPVALHFLPHIKEAKKIIVREAIHLFHHKNKELMKKIFIEKVNLFILSSDECQKIYNDFFEGKVKLAKIYNPLGITPKIIEDIDSKSVISVGRLDTHKGYDYLIRSWVNVNECHPDWILRIVGDGYYKEKMVSLIKELNLEDKVLLVPSSKNIVEELIKSSIYVMSSRFEGYANALVEAMSCGLASITYNWLVGPDEIIKDGINGLMVYLEDRFKYFETLDINENDINSLSKSINLLIEDKELRQRLSNESVKIIESRKQEKIIEEWKKHILRS